MSRTIYIHGEINSDTYSDFVKALQTLSAKSVKPITIDLNSEGGSVEAALGIVSHMRLSKCDFVVNLFGSAESAAVIILAAGDTRRMAQEAWVMVHEEGVMNFSGRVTKGEKYFAHLRSMEDQWDGLLEKYTGTGAASWKHLHKQTTYLTAQQCIGLGLVDEIV